MKEIADALIECAKAAEGFETSIAKVSTLADTTKVPLETLKKAAYLLAVVVAIVADWVVQTAAGQIGVDFGGFFFFGLLVTIWLVLNECISILENISQIGVPLPSFLVTLIENLL